MNHTVLIIVLFFKIMTADGENLQVTMKDGQSIPVQISTNDEDEEGEEETAKSDVDNSTYHLALPHVVIIVKIISSVFA